MDGDITLVAGGHENTFVACTLEVLSDSLQQIAAAFFVGFFGAHATVVAAKAMSGRALSAMYRISPTVLP